MGKTAVGNLLFTCKCITFDENANRERLKAQENKAAAFKTFYLYYIRVIHSYACFSSLAFLWKRYL